ncbi:MAG: DUF3108 domain-containing protein, partial [Bradymonadaceae bacterium]
FPWEGEEFYYSLRINGAEALRASLKTGRLRESGDRRYVPLALRVRSVGWFDEMYPVDDRGDTYLDPTTFRPYYSEKRFDEGGEVITYRVDFRRGEYRARVAKRRPNKLHEFTMPLPAATHDMMTWLYDFRRHRLERGDSFQYYVYDGW